MGTNNYGVTALNPFTILKAAEGASEAVTKLIKANKTLDAVETVEETAKRTTILGENMMERVIPFAEKTDARTLPFGTTPEKWAEMTPKERWKLNDGALRKRINEGDNFRYIGVDPNRPNEIRQKFDLTRSEFLRLDSRNIEYEVVSPEEVYSVLGRN